MPADQQDNQGRRFHRIQFEAEAHLYSGNAVWQTQMHDISLKGILLDRPDPSWNGEVGQRYRVDLRLEGGIHISMTVTVANIGDRHVGFHCDRIDMASFAHLKRLVELNLGDPSLLNRELAALG